MELSQIRVLYKHRLRTLQATKYAIQVEIRQIPLKMLEKAMENFYFDWNSVWTMMDTTRPIFYLKLNKSKLQKL